MTTNNVIDSFKSMMITMAMVKSTTSAPSGDAGGYAYFMHTFLLMLMLSFIDSIAVYLKNVFNKISRKVDDFLSTKSAHIPSILHASSYYSNQTIKKSSVIVRIEPGSKNPTSDAIIDCLTNLPHTKCILLQNGTYSINYIDEIEITKGLYACMVHSSTFKASSAGVHKRELTASDDTNIPPSPEPSSPETPLPANSAAGYIDIYSYTMDMEMLRSAILDIVREYLIKMNNKLGNNIYYFSEAPPVVYRDIHGNVDKSKQCTDVIHFNMKPFVTGRSFKNLFGRDIDIIRKRVEFFRDNKGWYDNKGVPYTLGILVSGNPGSGKTSIIKCIANELKRHIVNVHLSNNMTVAQVENLFYSEQLHVTQSGRTETFTIPINRRVYVFEDIDCQCDIIMDRGTNTAEQILAAKNAELNQENERLRFMLSEIEAGRKIIMSGGLDIHSKKEAAQKKKDDEPQKITLSFLLNLFDGVLETPGRIVFMTTNFLNKLDRAFTRPGRIDICAKFGFTTCDQLVQIIEHRYDVSLTPEQFNLVHNIPFCITPAEVSRILFENFNDLDGALSQLAIYATECMNCEILNKKKETELQTQVLALETEATTRLVHNVEPAAGEVHNVETAAGEVHNVETAAGEVHTDNCEESLDPFVKHVLSTFGNVKNEQVEDPLVSLVKVNQLTAKYKDAKNPDSFYLSCIEEPEHPTNDQLDSLYSSEPKYLNNDIYSPLYASCIEEPEQSNDIYAYTSYSFMSTPFSSAAV